MTCRRRAMWVGALAAIGVLGSSWAWACTAVPTIVSVEPARQGSPNAGPGFGPAGSQVTVRGNSVAKGAVVTLRWNGTNGQVVGSGASTPAGMFAVDATIPPSPAGFHYLVAEVAGVGIARTAFEVVDESAPPVRAGLGASDPSWASGSATRSSDPALVGGMIALAMGMVLLVGGVALATTGRRPRFASATRR